VPQGTREGFQLTQGSLVRRIIMPARSWCVRGQVDNCRLSGALALWVLRAAFGVVALAALDSENTRYKLFLFFTLQNKGTPKAIFLDTPFPPNFENSGTEIYIGLWEMP